MEKIHGNTHVFVLSCKFLTCKHKNMRVSMCFLHLELTFTPPLHHNGLNTIAGCFLAKFKSGYSSTTLAAVSFTLGVLVDPKNSDCKVYLHIHVPGGGGGGGGGRPSSGSDLPFSSFSFGLDQLSLNLTKNQSSLLTAAHTL